jgi:hypothetical protein
MDDMAAPEDPTRTIALQGTGFDTWCGCVRRLLDWSEGTGEDWPALYASGHAPRDAARATVYGDTVGD